MKPVEYIMDKNYFNSLAETLKEHDDAQEIIVGFTSCIIDMMMNDSAFLSVKNNREQREKIVQFQKDLLESTR